MRLDDATTRRLILATAVRAVHTDARWRMFARQPR